MSASQAPSRPLLLTRQQVAELLGVSPDTVRRLQRAGELPALRVGHLVMTRLSDVEAWIDSRPSY